MSLYSLAKSSYSDLEWINEIERVRELLVQLSKPAAIILFGSSITSDRTAESDIDLAIIFETKDEVDSAPKKIFSKGPLSDVSLDLLFFTREGFLSKVGEGGLVQHIQEQGRLIHGSLSRDQQ